MTQAANLPATKRLDAAWYPEFEGEWDARAFRQQLLRVIGPKTFMLDIGAGRGAMHYTRSKGMGGENVGADLNFPVLTKTQVDCAKHAHDGLLTSLMSDYFDVVISEDVVEHIEQSEVFLIKIACALKPGSAFQAKVPNGMHLMPVTALLTPHSSHKTFSKLRGHPYVVNPIRTHHRVNARRGLPELQGPTVTNQTPWYYGSNP